MNEGNLLKRLNCVLKVDFLAQKPDRKIWRYLFSLSVFLPDTQILMISTIHFTVNTRYQCLPPLKNRNVGKY